MLDIPIQKHSELSLKKLRDLRRWNIGISIINKHFREPSIVNRESVTATIGARILTLNFFPGWNLLTTHFRESWGVNRESIIATIGARILTLDLFPGWSILTTHHSPNRSEALIQLGSNSLLISHYSFSWIVSPVQLPLEIWVFTLNFFPGWSILTTHLINHDAQLNIHCTPNLSIQLPK